MDAYDLRQLFSAVSIRYCLVAGPGLDLQPVQLQIFHVPEKIFDHLDQYNPVYALKGWIRKIAVNTAIDKLRVNKNKNHPVFLDLKYIGGATSDGDEFIWDEEKELLPVIQNLPPGYRAVFNLYVFEEYTHKEIAKLLEISEGTSKSNYARAKKILKKRLTNQSSPRKGNMSLFIKNEPLQNGF